MTTSTSAASVAAASAAAMSKEAERARQVLEAEVHIQKACARAFKLYNEGNVQAGTQAVERLLRQQPSHTLPHYMHVRIAHKAALEMRLSDTLQQPFDECLKRVAAALVACPHSLIIRLLSAEVCFDTLRSPRANTGDEHWWACCDSTSPDNVLTPAIAWIAFNDAKVGQ